MPAHSIVLTDHSEQVIEDLIASGRYQNASEVMNEGLRLIEEREADDAAKLKVLRTAIEIGIGDLERDDYVEFNGVDEVRRHIETLWDKSVASTK